MIVLFAMVLSHFVCDFALQSDWIAKNKNRHASPAGYDPKLHGPQQTIWPWVLTSHAATHAAGIWVATGSPVAAFAELIAHWVIDFGKCDRRYGIHTDQILHLVTKVAIYAALVAHAAHADEYHVLPAPKFHVVARDTIWLEHVHRDTTLIAFYAADHAVLAVATVRRFTVPCLLADSTPAHSPMSAELWVYPRKRCWSPADSCWRDDGGWKKIAAKVGLTPCTPDSFAYADTSGGRWTTYRMRCGNAGGFGQWSNLAP